MPKSRATWRWGTPSATSRRIRAQSSTEITHPICLGGLVFKRRRRRRAGVARAVSPLRPFRSSGSCWRRNLFAALLLPTTTVGVHTVSVMLASLRM
jgi:hypothetical protein